MSGSEEDSVHRCQEPVARALFAISTGPSGLPSRVAEAALHLVMLEPLEFPPDLRIHYTRIRERVTAEGSVDDTAAAMTVEAATDIAKDIYELAAEVHRRYAIETQDY